MTPRGRHQLIFRLAALILPLALLGLAELACRLGGYGGYPPLIRRIAEDGDRTWYATNRAGTNAFFKGRNVAGGGMRELQFMTPKLPGTVRILFLGESAIQGFPQPLPLTDGCFLEVMLSDAWRGARRAEVLNLGATAVASYPVTCILDEALEHQPDLVVLMVGNNEFFGAYGVASLPLPGRSPLGLRVIRAVRGLGLSQWLESVTAPAKPSGGQLMAGLAVDRPIRRESSLRRAAAGTLRADMLAMVRRCVARGTPVIVCTVPTNERDLYPIGLDVEPRLPAASQAVFEEKRNRAEMLLISDPAGAEQFAREALELWSDHARTQFIRGRALTALGRDAEALESYVRARDLDTMPWRATSAAQEAVREAASAGAVLCDMEGAFRAASPGGAIGWELLDDHVHFSLRGQALFARTIAATMATMPEPLRVDKAGLDGLPEWDRYAEGLGHSLYSDYLAATHLRTLFNIPFMKRTNEPVAQRYVDLCRTLRAAMGPADSAAVEMWHDPSMHGATERPLEFVVGLSRMAAGDYATAADLFRVARSSVSLLSLWRLEMTWRLLSCNRHLHEEPTEEDVRLGREVIRIGQILNRHAGTRSPEVLRYLGLASNLAGDHAEAVKCLEAVVLAPGGRDDRESLVALADSYRQLGRSEEALKLLGPAGVGPGGEKPRERASGR